MYILRATSHKQPTTAAGWKMCTNKYFSMKNKSNEHPFWVGCRRRRRSRVFLGMFVIVSSLFSTITATTTNDSIRLTGWAWFYFQRQPDLIPHCPRLIWIFGCRTNRTKDIYLLASSWRTQADGDQQKTVEWRNLLRISYPIRSSRPFPSSQSPSRGDIVYILTSIYYV